MSVQFKKYACSPSYLVLMYHLNSVKPMNFTIHSDNAMYHLNLMNPMNFTIHSANPSFQLSETFEF